ncbi:hypothetical protein BCY84_10333 [Trypanosoma cruzi cruzi]|nr:hypothetical protein BCY84_10330 [Trypanosoma cruzi cruzi]PBJ76072.1 hypothetical protein BCY84_10333 [Trypanosoma cruzi cruzi]
MHIAMDLDASFVASAGGCGWLLLPLVGMKGREERERTASHSSCGCDARGGLRLPWRAASFRCACNGWKFWRHVMDGCGIASACGSLGDC